VRHRRRNPMMLFGAPRKRRHHRRRSVNRHHRRRNPSGIGSLDSGGILEMSVGGGIGFLGARMIPQNLPFLASYNSGIPGYALNAASGGLLAWLLGRFWNKKAATGCLIGTAVAVIARVVTDMAGTATPSTTAGTTAAMSGLGSDLDFDLGYYITEFPFPQGAAGGPYQPFVGSPYQASPWSNTNASAVRAGQAAAAAALPAGVAASAAPLAHSGGMAERWTNAWS
jgi:hypothetical protein